MALLLKVRDFVRYVYETEGTPKELQFSNDEEYQAILNTYAKKRN